MLLILAFQPQYITVYKALHNTIQYYIQYCIRYIRGSVMHTAAKYTNARTQTHTHTHTGRHRHGHIHTDKHTA